MKHIIQIFMSLSLMACVAVNAAEKITYYHNDLLGSPVMATDEAGAVLWQEDYMPFGERIDNAPQTANNDLWYTNKAHDNDTGLSYFGARYYHPVVGRFMAVDPVGFTENNPMMFNRYAYANNNPYKYVDPDGNNPKLVADFALNVALNYVTTGELGLISAAKETALGALNPLKTINTAGNLIKAVSKGKGVAKKVNGNSKQSTKAQHGYEIVDTKTNTVCKTGVSGCGLNQNGTSPRANSQANKWNKEPGNEGRYQPRVVKEVPAGPGARQDILKWEQQNAARLRQELDPARHSRP